MFIYGNLPTWKDGLYIETGHIYFYNNGLVQDCSISIANAMEILQSCTKPLERKCPCDIASDVATILMQRQDKLITAIGFYSD